MDRLVDMTTTLLAAGVAVLPADLTASDLLLGTASTIATLLGTIGMTTIDESRWTVMLTTLHRVAMTLTRLVDIEGSTMTIPEDPRLRTDPNILHTTLLTTHLPPVAILLETSIPLTHQLLITRPGVP